jgi:uncharacterized membrane protein
MSDLITVVFNDTFKAEQVRLDLLRMQHQHLVDLEEAAVVVHDQKGNVRLHHVSHFTLPGALSGGFIGTLAGLMLFNPALALIGLVAGSGIGAAVGALKEVGIDEAFMKQLASHLTPGSSALFILAKRADPARIREELQRYDGNVLQTPLTHDDEAKLRSAIQTAEHNSRASS